MPTASQRVFCPIKGFTVFNPDGESWLAYDFEPLPPSVPSLKERAAAIGKRIAAEQDAYLRQRLAEIAWEVG